MFPAYMLLLITLWRIYRINIGAYPKLTFIRIFGYAMVLFTIIIAWFLPNLLAAFSLPEPTGKYAVGSKWIHVKRRLPKIL